MTDDRSKPAEGHQRPIALWARAILGVDRAAQRALRLESALRDELLWSWTSTADREAITAAIYATQGTYSPGGALHSRGLFGWEREVLTREPFASRTRWLLGGAGGGRELFALMDMGHTVLAFEPCRALWEGAQSALKLRSEGVMYPASYEDLVHAAEGHGGPLEGVLSFGPEAVVLGWGSFSHVHTELGRERLLRAVKALAPDAPLFLSFLPRVESTEGRVTRIREAVNKLSRSLGAPEDPEPWSLRRGFLPAGGFVLRMSEAELCEIASRTGYSMDFCEMQPYPHAVLRPLPSPGP